MNTPEKDYSKMTEAELCFEIDKRESYNLMRQSQIANLKDELRAEQVIITRLKDQLKIKKALAA